MPLRNGLSTAEAMHDDPALRNIPIVVMSAAGNLQGLAPAVIRLSSAIIAKPFDVDRLLEVVERLTGHTAPFVNQPGSSAQSPSLM
jgi:CheY-like chemotaxis protein